MATKKSPTRKTTTRTTPDRRPAATTVRTEPAAKPVPKVRPVKIEKSAKLKKPKLVRDSFTIPKNEYGVIAELKTRGHALGRPVKKSELLRAGIKLLVALSDTALKAALQQVPVIKTGRPKSAK